ncbi:hypothetical protein PIB30_078043 [Stylosanthes scabra]|uniref:Uncharacterized protein n=1 Tax=Stylosanthes scabra TaxID=79078 RepID=A0ABU6VQV3_9FABA|nr:hypothetical protein [Stylosanthes scabra]
MAKRKDHRQKKKSSVCEISMMLVANIISLSSVRFSGPSCFTTNNLTPQDDYDAPSTTTSSPITTKLSHKSQRFERATKPRSYLQNPELVVNNNDPYYNYVDISAGNYIRHVHDKIHQGANSYNNNNNTTKRFSIFAIPCSTSSYKYG